MARSDRRYSIYPAPTALDILGASSPSLNQAVECWAALLARATADNAKQFYCQFDDDFGGCHGLHDWCLLAEVLKGKRFDPDFANPGMLIATAVDDSERLTETASKWFISHRGGPDTADKEFAAEFGSLVKKLREVDYAHAWAIIVAVQWYWENHRFINFENDAWWTLSFRRSFHQKQGSKQKTTGAGGKKKKNPRSDSKPSDAK
jgi:hypothetical protein